MIVEDETGLTEEVDGRDTVPGAYVPPGTRTLRSPPPRHPIAPMGKRIARPSELPGGGRFQLGGCKNAFDPRDCDRGEMRIARGPHHSRHDGVTRTV